MSQQEPITKAAQSLHQMAATGISYVSDQHLNFSIPPNTPTPLPSPHTLQCPESMIPSEGMVQQCLLDTASSTGNQLVMGLIVQSVEGTPGAFTTDFAMLSNGPTINSNAETVVERFQALINGTTVAVAFILMMEYRAIVHQGGFTK